MQALYNLIRIIHLTKNITLKICVISKNFSKNLQIYDSNKDFYYNIYFSLLV